MAEEFVAQGNQVDNPDKDTSKAPTLVLPGTTGGVEGAQNVTMKQSVVEEGTQQVLPKNDQVLPTENGAPNKPAESPSGGTEETFELTIGENVYTIDAGLKAYIDSQFATIQELQGRQSAIEEFNNDPQMFLSKYAPHIVLQNFDRDGFIAEKINKKWGTQNEDGSYTPFNPIPSEIWTPGTQSYKYRKDLEAAEMEADKYINAAQGSVSEAQQRAEEALEADKNAVCQELGIERKTFDEQIWARISQTPKRDILKVLARAFKAEGTNAEFKANIKETIQKANGTPSITKVMNGGGGVNVDKDRNRLEMWFGKDRVKEALG